MTERSPIDVRVLEAIKDVMDYLNSFRYDDSDSMVDYFSTNFYYHVSIGKYEKPCVIKPPINWKLEDKSKKEINVA